MAEDILVIGLGSIGAIYSCILQFSGQCNVHVVARSNYNILKACGLTLVSPKFGNHHGVKFTSVYCDCEEAAASGKKFSYVLCATKSILGATPSLSTILSPVISESTTIALLQNGVGIEEPLHLSYPSNTIISAVVWTGGRALPCQDGLLGFEQFWGECLTIGVDYLKDASVQEKANQRSKLERLVELLRGGGGECQITDDIQKDRWMKVIFNATVNSITTLVRMRTGPYFASSPYSYPLIEQLLVELISVARAKGINIPANLRQQLLEKCRGLQVCHPSGITTSMMMDNLAGRNMEVECILGTPLREAAKAGVKVPTLLTLYTLIKALDYGNTHPGVRID